MQDKRLQDLTLAELWELFPIVLTPHNPQWTYWAEEEIRWLSSILAKYSPAINHIGSTAIPEIQAKPIVDILVEVSPEFEWLKIKKLLESNGYICMSESETRISFNKGYTPAGYADRVFHVHVHRTGDNDEILFRDYLIANPESAKEYERLKHSLLPKYKNNRDGYTEAKTEFINRITALAKSSMEKRIADICIETRRLILRRWHENDADALYRYASDRRVSEMALWPQHTSVEMSRQVIRDFFIPNPFNFAIILKENNEPIGCIGLVPPGDEHFIPRQNEREVGYWIGYPYWGKGLTTEALNSLIVFCRDNLRLNSFLITTDAENKASQRVAEKCGFTFIADTDNSGIPTKVFRLSFVNATNQKIKNSDMKR